MGGYIMSAAHVSILYMAGWLIEALTPAHPHVSSRSRQRMSPRCDTEHRTEACDRRV
jgi:hypothetical protein